MTPIKLLRDIHTSTRTRRYTDLIFIMNACSQVVIFGCLIIFFMFKDVNISTDQLRANRFKWNVAFATKEQPTRCAHVDTRFVAHVCPSGLKKKVSCPLCTE